MAAAAGATVVRLDGDPPAGWLGKPRACLAGAEGARTEWLAFVDADVVLAPAGPGHDGRRHPADVDQHRRRPGLPVVLGAAAAARAGAGADPGGLPARLRQRPVLPRPPGPLRGGRRPRPPVGAGLGGRRPGPGPGPRRPRRPPGAGPHDRPHVRRLAGDPGRPDQELGALHPRLAAPPGLAAGAGGLPPAVGRRGGQRRRPPGRRPEPRLRPAGAAGPGRAGRPGRRELVPGPHRPHRRVEGPAGAGVIHAGADRSTYGTSTSPTTTSPPAAPIDSDRVFAPVSGPMCRCTSQRKHWRERARR